MRRALAYQARSLACLWFWVRRRRQGVAPGDIELGYAREQLPMLVVLAGALAVETAVVGLLVPWLIVHVLDVLAVLQVLGIAAAMVTRPHYVSADALVLREGADFELRIPLTAVAAVRRVRRNHNGPTIELSGRELAIVIGNQTDVVVTLAEPVTFGSQEIDVVRFRADEAAAAVSVIEAGAIRAGRSGQGLRHRHPQSAGDESRAAGFSTGRR